MLSLGEAVKAYRSWRGMARETARPDLPFPLDDPDHRFRPSWVPILDPMRAAIYVCDAAEHEASPVWCIDAMYEEPWQQMDSLGQLVTWIREAYEAGVWSEDPSGVWRWHKERMPPERIRATDLF